MDIKYISPDSLAIIEQFLHFKCGSAVTSIPYFNNKTIKARVSFRARIGKGNPKEILDELQTILVKNHLDANSLADESLKKILVDENLGIDCSGFAYYVLNAENKARGFGYMDRKIHFINCHGIVGKLRCSLRPIENCDVATLANDRNSSIIPVDQIQPGDFITMLDNSSSNRDHILVIHEIAYQDSVPVSIAYTHAVSYPEDGIYGSGIKQGDINITKINKDITDQEWIENSKVGASNRIWLRSKNSKTQVRRFNWFV